MPFLQFKGKTAVESYHRVVPHHLLEVDKKLSLSKAPGLDGNLIIEGDNLIALKSLLPTHAGKIKCVYIDPPYNTGNEGWIYNDNLTQPQFKEWIGQVVGKEGEDATRHDKWCCMMYPRLQLLKELMTDDGVILVSIDDNELFHLRLMMDEIFGSENFITCIVWKTRNTDNRIKTMLSVDHEYVVVYSLGRAPLRGRFIDRSDFSNPDNDARGPYVTDPLTGKATFQERPNLHFTITNPKTKDKWSPDPAHGWITDTAGVAELIREDKVWWPPNPKTGKPRKKRFLSETSERMPASSFWSDLRSETGADEVAIILGEPLFAFPKSVEFMRAVLDLAMSPDDIILDSTAGSGTTAHAVLAANAQDKGNRRFILIQAASDTKKGKDEQTNICDRITRERVRRAIAGYTFETKGKRETVNGLGGDFTYIRVGRRMFNEYRDLGTTPPTFEQMAQYIWFTETSRTFDPKQINPKTGHIGTWQSTSYYLLYSNDKKEARALDSDFLSGLKDKAPRKVIYCEKLWIHRDKLREFGDVRAMIVPFNLK
jgi:DNA modification methylase